MEVKTSKFTNGRVEYLVWHTTLNRYSLFKLVLEPTHKSNILDLIFSPDDFVNSIDVTDSVLSDHHIITAKTSVAIWQV